MILAKFSIPSMLSQFRRKLGRMIWPAPASVEELIELVRCASRNHIIEYEVHDIIERVLRVSALRIRDVMIPRVNMKTINVDSSLDEILTTVSDSGHSRFPVLGGPSDNEAKGILLAKDILNDRHGYSVEEFNLYDNLREPMFVPESMRLNTLLKQFRESRYHMAIVVNEYNEIAGLVTIEDVLEQIVGEIEDESDYEGSELITKISENHFTVHGQTDISDFNEYVNTNIEEDTDTIGGVILKLAGKVPNVGDQFHYKGLNFEVANADQRRILLLRVTRSTTGMTDSS